MKNLKQKCVGLIMAYQVTFIPKDVIPEKLKGIEVKKESKVQEVRTRPKIKPMDENKLKAMIAKQDALLDEMMRKLQSSKSIQRKLELQRIPAMSRMKGIILNSVVASNSIAETFVVKITEDHEFKHAEFKCSGVAYEKRLKSRCDLMVHEDDEFNVDVLIWDKNGATGPLADHWYTSEEKEFLSLGLARFMEGAANLAQSRTMTNMGSVTNVNQGNQLLNGLSQMGQSAGRKFEEAAAKRVEIAMIEAGKEVIVFFNQSVKPNKEEGNE